MKLLTFFGIIFYASTTVTAAPFTGWFFGGQQQNNDDTGTRSVLLNKVQQFGEKVYERKRDFLKGVNEKVSNLLWTTTQNPYVFYQDPPTETESYEIPNVEMYARSSFLSPNDLVDVNPPPENDKSTVTYNINKNFNILERIWS